MGKKAKYVIDVVGGAKNRHINPQFKTFIGAFEIVCANIPNCNNDRMKGVLCNGVYNGCDVPPDNDYIGVGGEAVFIDEKFHKAWNINKCSDIEYLD